MSFDRSGAVCDVVPSMPLAVGGDTATPKNLRLRFELMKQHIAPGDFVIDVGCGRAEYLRLLLTHTPNAFGIETAARKLADCFALHPELQDRVLAESAESMPFPSEHFDVVIVNEVLEHIADEDAALREIHRVLKPGGKFLLFCPNRLFPFETHGFRIRGAMRRWIPAVHYLPAWAIRGLGITPVARNYWPSEVSRLLRRYGFRIERQTFVPQTFENISRSQPAAIRVLAPALQGAMQMFSEVPGVRAFTSVSSFVIAVRSDV